MNKRMERNMLKTKKKFDVSTKPENDDSAEEKHQHVPKWFNRKMRRKLDIDTHKISKEQNENYQKSIGVK